MIAWYIIPYVRNLNKIMARNGSHPRYCVVEDYRHQIDSYDLLEISNDRSIVKISASAAVITAADGMFKRLPKDLLDSPLSDLTLAQKTALKNELIDQGFVLSEIRDQFGDDLGSYTLKQVLIYMAKRISREGFLYQRPDAVAQLERIDNGVS